ncbi:sugar ABC transporter permease [Cohnella sp. LGH]|uniref:Multiple sugar transport system permease protein n=1 Tax=Cohnella phaseoli TaxID=456490 RepID=A0A3D9INW0_9BACL|nr:MULTISPECIES: sugar ABC transporter permease [Cohnella]QTH41150.1 sugar ABC transporter permease [Cohnella sp. LGH]RED63425.1 multiple sugar transport system permease protein [Cohnella phaseoli]
MSYTIQKKIVVFSFLAIPVGLLLLFLLYPTVKLFQFSLTDWNGIGNTYNYVGFDHYKDAFQRPEVWNAFSNNLLYFGIHAVFIPLEIMVAVFLNNKIRASSFFRSIVFLPYILNGVAVAYLFSYLYNPINGPLNALLEAVGLESWIQSWLSDKGIVNYSLVAVSIWRFSGLHVVLFLAGLQSIPSDLYEAARIDGASAFGQFRHITVPGIARVVEIVLFLNVRGALQVFDIPFLMTQGGPGNASSTFTVYTIQTAFKYNNYGLASALAVILMIIIIVFSYMQGRFFKGKGD